MENLNFTQPQDELSKVAWDLLLRKDSSNKQINKSLQLQQNRR